MLLRRGTVLIALFALVAGGACGRFASSSSGVTSTTVLSAAPTLPPLDTTSTRPGQSGVYSPPPAPTGTTRDRCAPPNTTVRDDPSGFRLILTVAPKQCVSRSDDLSLQLEIQNISKQPLQYDSNQKNFFSILPEGDDVSRPGWDDTRCRPREANPTVGGPLTLQPGERAVRARATYPGPKNQPNREQCRVLERGSYAATATFTWCPPGSVVNGVCDPGKAKTIDTAPLLMSVS